MNKRIYIVVGIVFTTVCILLFYIFSNEARQTAIKNLNEMQWVQARQAARGLESFFTNRTNSLIALSKMEDIINDEADGHKDLNLFYEAHSDQITAITRIDEKGTILYNFPSSKDIIGKNISNQIHVQQMLKDHKPVVSDIFLSIENTRSVAILVPVFKGKEFKGSIGVLIDFKNLAKHYFETIKIGRTGYAWVLSRDGTVLYSPIPGFIGTSEYKNAADFPSLLPVVKDMLKGHSGTAEFLFDKVGDKVVPNIKKYSIYMPIYIGNTFWSINVSTTEDDVLSDLNSFRNKLIFLLVGLFIFGALFSFFGVKAWLIINEEEKRKAAENELRKDESRFRSIFNNLQDAYFEADTDGKFIFVSPSALQMYGFTAGEISGLNASSLYANENERDELFEQLTGKGKVKDYVGLGKRKDGSTFWVSMNVQFLYDEKKQICGTAGLVRDITERKLAEEERIKSEARYRNIYDNAIEGMYSTSMDGKVLHVNNALAKILGYDSPDDVFNTIADTGFQIWRNPEERKKYVELQQAGKVLKGFECKFRRKDDSWIWVTINSKLVRDEKGNGLYFEGFIEDISERKSKELEIESKMKELQWYFDISMQRELKMADLKKEINELLVKDGKEKRYL